MNAERIEREQPKDVLGEIAKQKWTGHYPERESVNDALEKSKLKCSQNAKLASRYSLVLMKQSCLSTAQSRARLKLSYLRCALIRK
jgi:hypothetical protein